jgi:inner membrane protein
LVGVVCSMLPDIDVIGYRLGVPYGAFWGHRGFTHSVLFACLLAGVVTILISWKALRLGMFRSGGKADPSPEKRLGMTSGGSGGEWRNAWMALWAYLFLVAASHGVLDAMTNGGLGVAFFSPFDTSRYFLPWRPIRVSPMGLSRFVSGRGLAVLQSESVWIWTPTGLVAMMACWMRRRFSAAPSVRPSE